MRMALTELELEQIIRRYLSDTYSSLELSEDNATVSFIKDGNSTRVDEVYVRVIERY